MAFKDLLNLGPSPVRAPEGGDGGDPAPDFAWAPEQFVQDGKLNTEAFRGEYDALVSFKAQHDEARAALPQDPSGYEIAMPKFDDMGDFLKEGEWPVDVVVDAEGNEVKDEKGEVVREPIALELASDDPRIEGFQKIAHKHGLTKEAVADLLRLHAAHEIRSVNSYEQELSDGRAAEMEKLGPGAQTRLGSLRRTAEAKLPAEMAQALMDSLTTADAVRGLEKLLSPNGGGVTTTSPGGKPGMADLSPQERLLQGLQMRQAS